MSSFARRVSLGNCVFSVDENVYEPAEDTFLFADNLNVQENDTVLDMGSGCGALGIIAAKKARSVLSVDMNPHAVRCAKANAAQNGVSNRMAFVQSDLFSALHKCAKFSLVLFNAPYLPVTEGETDSWIELSWTGGASGRLVIDRFIAGVRGHLAQAGRVLLMQSTLAGVEETIRRYEECSMNAQAIAQLALPFFETLSLIEARHR